MISAHSVCVQAGRARLLDGVTLSVPPGRVTAILGPNGAGKSTLLAVLAGGRRPDAGQVTLDGRPIATWSAPGLARRRAVLPQSTVLGFDFTVAEVVALGRQPFAGTPAAQWDAEAVDRAARQMEIAPLWRRAVPGLSGGEQQRVHMARALAQLWRPPGDVTPRHLLLDEPTAALDLRHRGTVLAVARGLAQAGVGVLAVLHDLTLAAALADEVALLRDGRLLRAGPPGQVMTAAALEECFGVPVEVLSRADGSPAFAV